MTRIVVRRVRRGRIVCSEDRNRNPRPIDGTFGCAAQYVAGSVGPHEDDEEHRGLTMTRKAEARTWSAVISQRRLTSTTVAVELGRVSAAG
jgi:hypothetical protein